MKTGLILIRIESYRERLLLRRWTCNFLKP